MNVLFPLFVVTTFDPEVTRDWTHVKASTLIDSFGGERDLTF